MMDRRLQPERDMTTTENGWAVESATGDSIASGLDQISAVLRARELRAHAGRDRCDFGVGKEGEVNAYETGYALGQESGRHRLDNSQGRPAGLPAPAPREVDSSEFGNGYRDGYYAVVFAHFDSQAG